MTLCVDRKIYILYLREYFMNTQVRLYKDNACVLILVEMNLISRKTGAKSYFKQTQERLNNFFLIPYICF